MENLPELSTNHPFDEHGDYLHTHEIQANLNTLESKCTLENRLINNNELFYGINKYELSDSLYNIQSLQPQLGWLPINVIVKTLEKTTQFYRCGMSTRLLKHYKSPFPACNVHQRNEPIATDTVYSNTPAINSGCKCAQIFVGTKTMVTDVYGMKTEKQFVNTLQDIIRTRGAPTKLISNHANVEISNEVKDILCYLMIPDWKSEPYHQHQNPTEQRY